MTLNINLANGTKTKASATPTYLPYLRTTSTSGRPALHQTVLHWMRNLSILNVGSHCFCNCNSFVGSPRSFEAKGKISRKILSSACKLDSLMWASLLATTLLHGGCQSSQERTIRSSKKNRRNLEIMRSLATVKSLAKSERLYMRAISATGQLL